MLVSEKFLLNYDEKHTLNMMQELYSKISDSDFKGSYMFDFNREKLLNYVKNSNFDCDFPDY